MARAQYILCACVFFISAHDTAHTHMIEYIKGELTEINPTEAVVEVNGVGYLLNISLNTYSAIQGKKEVKLYVDESLVTGGRDDSYTLYGFYNKQEREIYRMLITVSGVGSNTARMILSATSATELVNIIASGNEKALKGVKGIGLKTAQRIIVDLRDKMTQSGLIADTFDAANIGEAGKLDNNINSQTKEEAVGALTMLGFSPAPSSKVVTEILRGNPDMPVEQVIKQALKMIK